MRIHMRHIAIAIAFALSLGSAPIASSSGEDFAAEGVVIAVQKAKGEIRTAVPDSMGDMVEVWMVQVYKWPRPERPGTILVEYSHRDAVVSDNELDNTVWRFEMRPAPATESGTCMSWWSAERSFIPTALGAKQKLPEPKELGCFLMRKRPVAIREAKQGQERPTSATRK
jgi:hypothetical protein